MNSIVGRAYSILAAVVFILLFLMVFPFQFLFLTFPSGRKIALWFNYVWAWGFFIFTFVPVRIRGLSNKPNGQFIYCANHFSYLDIPAMGLLGGKFKFLGKNAMSKIPLFGYMYEKLHVTVDRASRKSRAEALKKAQTAIKEGFNMAIFPEGGVRLTNYPEMAPFRDGIFRLAVENQLPIVPVTMPRNHLVWPYDRRQYFFGGRIEIFIHEAIYPKGNDESEIVRLKEEVRAVMQSNLDAHAVTNSINIAIS